MNDGVEDDLEKIGAALRDARLQALLSQSEVAQCAGVSRRPVSRIEQGLNGEITAYAAVAAALEYRLTLAATGIEGATPGAPPTIDRPYLAQLALIVTAPDQLPGGAAPDWWDIAPASTKQLVFVPAATRRRPHPQPVNKGAQHGPRQDR